MPKTGNGQVVLVECPVAIEDIPERVPQRQNPPGSVLCQGVARSGNAVDARAEAWVQWLAQAERHSGHSDARVDAHDEKLRQG